MGSAYHTLKSFRTVTAAFLCALYNLCYCMRFLGLVQIELEYCREPVLWTNCAGRFIGKGSYSLTVSICNFYLGYFVRTITQCLSVCLYMLVSLASQHSRCTLAAMLAQIHGFHSTSFQQSRTVDSYLLPVLPHCS